MASICKRSDGSRFIEFILNGERKTVSLGGLSKTQVEAIQGWIEKLVVAAYRGEAPDAETARWLGRIDTKLENKLAKVGLIQQRQPKAPQATATLEAFLTSYIDSRKKLKPSTRTNLEQTKKRLVEFFTAEKPLAEITAYGTELWREWLKDHFAVNTIRRCCGRARQFFKAAKRERLIAENPFAEMKDCQVKANKSRDHFVTRSEADAVLAACPSPQWQLLFALARYGGLRCPSEPQLLKWSDIDLGRGLMTVRSPKTESHAGKESRVVPIFPELRPYLDAAKAEAAKDAEWVMTIRTMRSPKPNPRTTMEKIVKAAGLTPWPKLFQNCRASRSTEIASAYPAHVEAEWLGHSPKTAVEHYLRVTDADYAKASSLPQPESAGQGAGETAQDKAQGQATAASGRLRQTIEKVLAENALEPNQAAISQLVEIIKAPPVGVSIIDAIVDAASTSATGEK